MPACRPACRPACHSFATIRASHPTVNSCADKDVIGLAQTGSGKTGAFALPILQVCARVRHRGANQLPPLLCAAVAHAELAASSKKHHHLTSSPHCAPTHQPLPAAAPAAAPACLPACLQHLLDKPQALFALVLSPTRELAIQIAEQFEALGSGIGVKCAVLVGGIDMMAQAIALAKRPHVVVGTPGRVVDHLSNTKGFSLKALKHLVLDEADRLLNMDFEQEIDQILKVIPKVRLRCSRVGS